MDPFAKLINWTPKADEIAMEAAALCYDASPSEKVINFCIRSGHHSVLEHNAFTFKIQVARIISQMFTRHRIASFSQRSQRYCIEDSFAFYTPPEIKAQPEANLKWKKFQKEVQDLYNFFIEHKIEPEEARMALTNATQTVFFMTMNARELRHFFKLRLCNRAQKEIRLLAWEMLKQLREVSPLLFKDIDYPCAMRGYCDQQKMSCGKMPTLEKIISVYNSVNKGQE